MAFPLIPLLTQGLGGIGTAVKAVAGVFRPNREAQAARDSSASSEELAARVSLTREELRSLAPPTNWFDSVINGIVRLQRPACFVGVGYVVVIAVRQPEEAQIVFAALALIPDWFQAVILAIVGGLWGARELEKARASKQQVAHAREVLAHVREMKKAQQEVATPKRATERRRPKPGAAAAHTRKSPLDY